MAQIAETRLVEAARDGDVGSLGELCQRYYAVLVSIAYAILSDPHLAEDAAQEALATACRDLRRLKRVEKFGTWLRTICRNVARRMGRSRTSVAVSEEVPSKGTDELAPDIRELVRRAVWRLPASQREVVVLRYFNGLPYQRIAVALGISCRAVDGRLARAKHKIAEYIKRNGSERGIL